MSHEKYRVAHSPHDEKTFRAIISHGQKKAEVIRPAYILLKSHDGKTDVEIAAELYIDDETVSRTRVRYVSIEMVYRSLYYFIKAHERGTAQDLISYLVQNTKLLGLVKRKPLPNKLGLLFDLTASSI